jgi:3-hydroxyisobutyrate dehydrogenase-like beta-hydroxyacid dehydrogenase
MLSLIPKRRVAPEGVAIMAKLAFLGLGQMGAPMAARLLAAGHDLAVWNRTAAKAEPLVQRGARLARTPADAARGAEAVFTMLADPEALSAVVFVAAGAREGLAPGAALVEMSTVGPDAIRSVRAQLSASVVMLDAPVLGSVPQAAGGTLQIFVGGAAGDYERLRPILECMGQPIHVGALGAGASLKLVLNSTLGALMTALGEAMALADACDLDQGIVLDALANSPIGVTTGSKREHIQNGTYPPRFQLALASKDMRLVAETAARAGCELRLAAAARGWFDAASAAGLGALDYSAVVAHIRRRPARLPG